jgi:hypothetical protein
MRDAHLSFCGGQTPGHCKPLKTWKQWCRNFGICQFVGALIRIFSVGYGGRAIASICDQEEQA